jgi:DNA-binding Xre family transcriptional regulator
MTPPTNRASRGRPVRQRRKVSYEWRLREVMAEHKMYATTELVPLLAERGINLSASQVHRLVTSTPERLSLPILAALCDIFAVDAAELIFTDAVSVGVRKAAAGDRPVHRTTPAGIGELRPVRARIVSPEE